MIKVSDAIIKLISTGGGNEHDINHFLKVWGFARTIGKAEGLDERTLKTLEFSAIVMPGMRSRIQILEMKR